MARLLPPFDRPAARSRTSRGAGEQRPTTARLACALYLSCLTWSPAHARTITFYAMGYGRSSCQEFLDASKGLEADHFRVLYKDARKYVTVNNVYDQWLFGAVTATNYASVASGRHPDVRPTTVEVVAWVRSWCEAHPDETMSTAVLTYLQEKWKVGATVAPPQPAVPAGSTPPAVAPQAPAPQFVFVIFRKDIAAADMALFLKTYRVAIDDGPNPDGYYKLRLAEPLPADQLDAMLGSMRGQKIVATAVSN